MTIEYTTIKDDDMAHKQKLTGKTKRALRLVLSDESPRSYDAQMRQLSRQRAKQDKWVRERRQGTLDLISDGKFKQEKPHRNVQIHVLPCNDE